MIKQDLKINNVKPKIFILKLMAGAVLTSFSGVFVKLANGVGPITAGFYRTLFGGISLIIFALIKEKKINFKTLLSIILSFIGITLLVYPG